MAALGCTIIFYFGGTDDKIALDGVNLMSEDQFKGVLEELTNGEAPGEQISTERVPSTRKTVNPLFGILLVVIAFIYLIILAVQVYKTRFRNRRHQDTSESSEYSYLSASDSESLQYRR